MSFVFRPICRGGITICVQLNKCTVRLKKWGKYWEWLEMRLVVAWLVGWADRRHAVRHEAGRSLNSLAPWRTQRVPRERVPLSLWHSQSGHASLLLLSVSISSLLRCVGMSSISSSHDVVIAFISFTFSLSPSLALPRSPLSLSLPACPFFLCRMTPGFMELVSLFSRCGVLWLMCNGKLLTAGTRAWLTCALSSRLPLLAAQPVAAHETSQT